jgi:hypothetical protein
MATEREREFGNCIAGRTENMNSNKAAKICRSFGYSLVHTFNVLAGSVLVDMAIENVALVRNSHCADPTEPFMQIQVDIHAAQ